MSFGQNHESIYALNSGVTTKNIIEGKKIIYNNIKPFPHSSYIKVKQKENKSFYIQTIISGKFAYGHYFTFLTKLNGEFKYVRTDGDGVEYIITNYSLNDIAQSNKHDEKVNLQLINYRTSFAMLLKF